MAKISLMFLLSLIREKVHDGPSHKTDHWSYEGINGPDSWPQHYEHCGGIQQSPINIDTKQVSYDPDLGVFDLSQFDVPSDSHVFNITNNGHSASAAISNEMYCKGGGLPGEFKTAEFHFHWGSDDSRGSEHGIDMKNYPLEMHIVHYNTKYGTLANAKSKPDGLAVLGVMFEISDTDNPNFEPITSALHNIRREGEREAISNLHISKLLPKNTDMFYRYKGSLTTPPCYESVTWTIFAVPQKISSTQMSALRLLKMGEQGDSPAKDYVHGGPIYPHASSRTNTVKFMMNNYRPFQDIHGRIVKKSFNNVPGMSAELKEIKMKLPVEGKQPDSASIDQTLASIDHNNIGASQTNSNIVGTPKEVTIMSGANQRPGFYDHVNAANSDQKAAATEARVSVHEQQLDMKLGSAHEGSVHHKSDHHSIGSMNMEPLITTTVPTTTATASTTTTTAKATTTTMTTTTSTTTQPTTTTTLATTTTTTRRPFYHRNIFESIKRLQITTTPLPYANPIIVGDSDTTLVKSLRDPNPGGAYHTIPSWLSKLMTHSSPVRSSADSQSEIWNAPESNNHLKTSHQDPITQLHPEPRNYPINTDPEPVSHDKFRQSPTYGGYQHIMPSRNTDPPISSHAYSSSSSNQHLNHGSGQSTAHYQSTNPFLNRESYTGSYTNSQYIPIPNRRPASSYQPSPPQWLLPQNRPEASRPFRESVQSTKANYPGSVTTQSKPKLDLPFQPKPLSDYQNYGLLESPANQNQRPAAETTPKLTIDRETLLRALKRIQALRDGQGVQTTTPKPEEKPYIWLHSSRDPVRVSNKYAKGMYNTERRYSSAYRSLGMGAVTGS